MESKEQELKSKQHINKALMRVAAHDALKLEKEYRDSGLKEKLDNTDAITFGITIESMEPEEKDLLRHLLLARCTLMEATVDYFTVTLEFNVPANQDCRTEYTRVLGGFQISDEFAIALANSAKD